jgi:hypothetical protein
VITEEHQLLVDMIMDDPPMAAWLLARCGQPVSPFDTAEAREGRISITTAFGTLEKAADAAVLFRQDGKPVRCAVVEPQRAEDPGKPRSCQIYAAAFWAVLGCPVNVIILSPREAVARRFATMLLAPDPDAPKIFVLGPSDIPDITAEQAADLRPSQILLSAAMAGKTGRIDIRAIELALTRVYENDQLFADRCLDTLCKYWLTKPDRRTLMSLIENRPYTFKSKPFLDRIKAAEAKAEAEAKVKTEAKDARRDGATLLQILDSRAITITRQVREDITACTDLDRLHAAILRAATADPSDPFTF